MAITTPIAWPKKLFFPLWLLQVLFTIGLVALYIYFAANTVHSGYSIGRVDFTAHRTA